jgi:hypothetical protein
MRMPVQSIQIYSWRFSDDDGALARSKFTIPSADSRTIFSSWVVRSNNAVNRPSRRVGAFIVSRWGTHMSGSNILSPWKGIVIISVRISCAAQASAGPRPDRPPAICKA